MEGFNPDNAVQQVAGPFYTRLEALGLSPEDLEQDSNILYQFCNIAVNMLMQDPSIEMPGASEPIQLEEHHILQGLTLFTEGLYLAMIKCLEMGIPAEIKGQLLQHLALDVFNQAKQIISLTYGQEQTPDVQIPHEQQVQLVLQQSESALMHYLQEYEKEHGPIPVIEPPAALLESLEQAQHTGETEYDPALLADTGSPTVAGPTKPSGPHPHDKYGAVALLLSALPADQRARILNNFQPDEKELIAFYSYPQHLEQNLDITSVQAHLKRFKTLLKQGGPGVKSPAYRGMARLTKAHPMPVLLRWLQDERPLIQHYIQAHYDADPTQTSGLESLVATHQSPQFSDLLPPRIEAILYQYLQRRVEAHAS